MKYGLLLDDNKYLYGFCHYDDERDTVEIPYEVKTSSNLNCWKYENNEFIFDETKAINEAKAREEEELRVKEKEEHLNKILESVKVTREPSDKLGFDWLVYKLGEYVFLKEYVESESHKGTEDDPIPFELGIELLPNAFYLYNNELWVWMGARIIATEYPNEDNFSWAKWVNNED